MPGSGSDRAAVNVILVPVKGTPLSLMTVLPASGRFDFRAPRQLLFSTAGLAALILAGMFFLLRLDMRNAVLRARLEEVTLREQTEIALRKSEDEYRSLFETSRDAILIADHSGYLDCNQASCALFGCKSKEDLIGKHPGEFSPELQPDGRNSFAEANEKISATIEKGIQFFEWVHKRHDGTTFPAEVLLSSSEFSGRPVVQAAIRDISERKILEEQLHHSQKMEAIGKLAGGIAHDFNNILTAIIGFSNLIKMKMKPDDPMHLEMDQVLAAADKAANLTRSLLVFSRKQVINQQSIDLNGIIRNLDKFMKRIIGEDVDLVLRLADKKLVVFADSGQLEQVLINLATNACDAMPQGGALTITTTSIEVDGGFADTRSLVKAGKYALLTVTDTGTGMDEETQQRIFEPFFTTKEFGKGTGLGLAVSYGIINQHNGYISVASAPDQGTTFSIYLPFGNELLVPGVRTIEPPPRGGVETILYAEDDDTIREMATQIMQDAGYQVIAARDGEEAVKGFMAHQDTINLLLFDLVMPKKNGKVASDEIRQIRPDIRTLFVSGYTADLLQRKGLYEEGLKLVMKPLAPAELLRQIRDILDREPKV
jgi:PAS domain S-box-containing protein